MLRYNEYYPFGLQATTSWTRESSKNNYLYNSGSELNQNSGWYETFFRGYDPSIGRFLQIDPMAATERATYQYAGNNPVVFNDPMGASKDDPTGRKKMIARIIDLDSKYSLGWSQDGGYLGEGFEAGGGRGFTYGQMQEIEAWEREEERERERERERNKDVVTFDGGAQGLVAALMYLKADESSIQDSNQILLEINGVMFGGHFQTENGVLTSVMLSRVIETLSNSASAWISLTPTAVVEVGKTVNEEPGFWDGFLSSPNTTYFGSNSAVVSYVGFGIDGIGNSVESSARTAIQINNATKLTPYFKAVGFVGNITVAGLNLYEGYQNDKDITYGEWFKVGISVVQAALIFSNPVVGLGVLAYNGIDLLVGISTGTTLTDRIANGIDNITHE